MKNNGSKAVQAKLFVAIIVAVLVTGLKKVVKKALAALVITLGLYYGYVVHMLTEWYKNLSLGDRLKNFFDKPFGLFVGAMIGFLVVNLMPGSSVLCKQMLKLIGKHILIAITVIIVLCNKKIRLAISEHKRLFAVDSQIFKLVGIIFSLVFINGFYYDKIYVEIPYLWMYSLCIGYITAIIWVIISFVFACLISNGKIIGILNNRYYEKIESVKSISKFVWWKLCRLFGIRIKKKNV